MSELFLSAGRIGQRLQWPCAHEAGAWTEGRRVTTPWFWRWIMLVVRTLPTAVFHRTKL